jgi:hypothetical protein
MEEHIIIAGSSMGSIFMMQLLYHGPDNGWVEAKHQHLHHVSAHCVNNQAFFCK